MEIKTHIIDEVFVTILYTILLYKRVSVRTQQWEKMTSFYPKYFGQVTSI